MSDNKRTEHSFGGTWTEIKLLRLEKYLKAYTKIFDVNEKAQYLNTTYVDAFAGTGYYSHKNKSVEGLLSLLPELEEAETQSFLKGSAQIALDIEPSFDRYLFIEQEQEYTNELHRLRNTHYENRHKIEIMQAEANSALNSWCTQQDWSKQRAVVFLDPYALEIKWPTLEVLGSTKVDLWLLWPIGQVINRLLTRNELPPESWANALTNAFGTESWKTQFYAPSEQHSLSFDENEAELGVVKTATFSEIEKFFVERLRTIFTHVAPNPLYLYNSRNVPLYLLCFASHNEKGLKIATDILRK